MFQSYHTLLAACRPSFVQERTFAVFRHLVEAWLLCTARRTVTGIITFIPGAARRAHDTYHHFFQAAVWEPDDLFDLLAGRLIRAWCPDGIVTLDLDDTLHHKSGRKVAGVGLWRDAVRSTGTHVVHALGLNLIVVTLRVTPPWGGVPLALPVRVRLHRKDGPSYFDLAETMIRDLAVLASGCTLRVCADGFYAPLATRLPRALVTLTSRLRKDAALYDHVPPQPAGKRGRKPTKGPRLPALAEIADEAAALGLFSLTPLTRQQATVERLVYARTAFWNGVLILLVIVRDPDGQEKDDYFLTTDLTACALDLPDHYGGRWSIEITFRDVKQLLGAQEPQCWADAGPARAAALAYWLYSLVWASFLAAGDTVHRAACQPTPWYPQKRHPAFADALAWLRRHLWRARIIPGALPLSAPAENPDALDLLIEHCARAA